MGATIIGPISQAFPSRAIPAMVQIRPHWSLPWIHVPELEFLGGNLATASHDLSSCVLFHRYGLLKHPWRAGYERKESASLAGCWVRVCLAGEAGLQEAWVGQIAGEGRNPFGSVQTDYGLIPAGAQQFEAFGPLQILRKLHVSRSWWRIEGETKELQWLPPLNEAHGRGDKLKQPLGSRSGNRYPAELDTEAGRSYVYGGTELWDYHQYATYLLLRFVDESATGGPRWTLGGQCDVLKRFTEPIPFGATPTVDEILRSLIRPEDGLDFKIVSTAGGFEVSVFVLTRESCGWGGQTLPGNPDSVRVYAGRSPDYLSTTVARTAARRYGTIRILGGRIVVCCSLFGQIAASPNVLPQAHGVASLGGLWNPVDLEDYEEGTGNPADSAYLHDLARAAEKYRDVFRKYGATPEWFTTTDVLRTPQWDGKGQPIAGNGPLQPFVRSTLPWLPLETGVDYSKNPPEDHNDEDVTPALRQPQVWFRDPVGETWTPIDKAGFGLSVLTDQLGVFLHQSPNHLVAEASGDDFFFGGSSDTLPLWGYQNMVATLAFLSDQRIYCEHKIQGAAPSDGVLEIDASDCQIWWLAPNTFVDVDSAGKPVFSPEWAGGESPAGCMVRNDWSRIAAKMAGALARHYQERARAQIVLKGLLPWGGLLGQILTVIDEGGDTQTIEAPITEVRWTHGEEPTTVISTGFATGD